MRAFQREMAGLLSDETAEEVCFWFKANDYRVFGGTIHPYHSGERGPKWVYPLRNPDLFLSFTRLRGSGRHFQERVLSWVRENGLLRRKDYSEHYYSDGTKDGEINHQSMTLREFEDEVELASNALSLLKQIRCGDHDGLRERITRARIELTQPKKHAGYYGNERLPTARAFLVVDGISTQVHVLADEPLSDGVVHEWAAKVLEYLVEQKLTRVGMIFTQDTRHPRPLSKMLGEVPYRPRLTPRCPDLESALWFQFASLIADKRTLRECSECHETFVGPERAKTCSARCRKRRSRRLQRDRKE